MKRIVVLIICLSTILCTFESCGRVKVKPNQAKNAWQAVKKIFTKPKPPKPPINFLEELRKADIARRKNLAIDIIKHCNLNNSQFTNKSETVIIKGCGNNEAKAIISNLNITKVIKIGNIFNTTFRELDYSAAKYNDIGYNLMEVIIPYYTRSGYAKSYVKIKFYNWNSSEVKRVINKLSREDENPYAKLRRDLSFIKDEDIEIVNFIENSIIAENNLMENDNERFGISYNTIA